MNQTVSLWIIENERRSLSARAERGWQRQQALQETSRRDRGVLASLLQQVHALALPRLRGTLAAVMPATPRGTGGPIVLDGAAGR